MKTIKEIVLEHQQKGNIVVAGMEGLQAMPLADFIKQPVEGMLYDLNRSGLVILQFIDDPKWVNDYATYQVICALKARIEELENLNKP
jgi:uncharacterized protein (UPF0218 family)